MLLSGEGSYNASTETKARTSRKELPKLVSQQDILPHEPHLAAADARAGATRHAPPLLRGITLLALLSVLGGCQRNSPIQRINQAALTGDAATVKQMLNEHPAIVNNYGTDLTPLECAVIGNHPDVAKMLLEHGADPNARDKPTDMNAVAHAVRKGNWPLVQLLLDHGGRATDVRFTKDNITPLIIAAIEGNTPVAEHLLALGADRTARDADGLTAADHARSNGHNDLAALLDTHATATVEK